MGCAHTVSSGSLNEAHSFAGAVKVIDDYQLCVASRAPKLPQQTADDHPGQIALPKYAASAIQLLSKVQIIGGSHDHDDYWHD